MTYEEYQKWVAAGGTPHPHLRRVKDSGDNVWWLWLGIYENRPIRICEMDALDTLRGYTERRAEEEAAAIERRKQRYENRGEV